MFDRAGELFAATEHTWPAAQAFMAAEAQRVVRGEEKPGALSRAGPYVERAARNGLSLAPAFRQLIDLARAYNKGDLPKLRQLATLPNLQRRIIATVPMLTASALAATALQQRDEDELADLIDYLDRLRRTVPVARQLMTIADAYARLLRAAPVDSDAIRDAFVALAALGGVTGSGYHIGLVGRLLAHERSPGVHEIINSDAYQSQYNAPNAVNRAAILTVRATHAASIGDKRDAVSLWNEALQVASRNGYHLHTTEALEALAATVANPEQCLLWTAAAQQLRDQTMSAFRFQPEQIALDDAVHRSQQAQRHRTQPTSQQTSHALDPIRVAEQAIRTTRTATSNDTHHRHASAPTDDNQDPTPTPTPPRTPPA